MSKGIVKNKVDVCVEPLMGGEGGWGAGSSKKKKKNLIATSEKAEQPEI